MSGAVTLAQIHARCRADGGCWIWQGALIRQRPYLSVHEGGVRFNRRVQKQVLELTGTVVPAQARITQRCGNPLCCAPAHQQLEAPRVQAAFLQALQGNPWAPLLWRAAHV
ncbi:hypothetical protein [Comamonas terrigena]|uniref:HNH endonuclease n=1 Tax=Comamonas terrigena TaxID=32013 RepID=A0A2A7UWW4_COMTR|nr:hypothetical protein [Comamonas terrigena]PEH89772.1 hypothetical protein CRM82_15220 [Comamonas terrigena]BBL24998.1 hypothetical protein CT3_24530 [Comamonas terrigena NBRC 13299]SUY71413.1 Uncharacterised protein [Comamonas terrigena]